MAFFAFIQYIHKLGDCLLAVLDTDVVYFLVGILLFGLRLLFLLLDALPLQGFDILFSLLPFFILLFSVKVNCSPVYDTGKRFLDIKTAPCI